MAATSSAVKQSPRMLALFVISGHLVDKLVQSDPERVTEGDHDVKGRLVMFELMLKGVGRYARFEGELPVRGDLVI